MNCRLDHKLAAFHTRAGDPTAVVALERAGACWRLRLGEGGAIAADEL